MLIVVFTGNFMIKEKLSNRYDRALAASTNSQRIYKAYRKKDKVDVDYEIFSTAAVKAFELAYETFWKYLKFYMEYQGILDIPSSPRAVFAFALQHNILNNHEVSILDEAARDRNLSSHMYAQETAEEILQDIPEAIQLFALLLHKLTPDK